MPLLQNIGQMPLAQRVPALADAVRSCRQAAAQASAEEAEYLDLLAQAEAQLAPDDETPRSGLITDNPYLRETPPASTGEGDAVDPATGKSSGDDPPAGS